MPAGFCEAAVLVEAVGEECPSQRTPWDESDPEMPRIYCAIYVERDSQKRIIIGKQGSRIKDIGSRARADIENLLGRKVYLELFVKVVKDWRNKERDLDEMGVEG